MKHRRYVDCSTNKKGEMKLTFGGMDLKHKIRFAIGILTKGEISFVLESKTVELINDIIDGYPVKKSKRQLYS